MNTGGAFFFATGAETASRKFRTSALRVCALIVAGLALGSYGFGATILTNIAAQPNGATSISGASATAVGFTMGATSYTLTDAMFILFNGTNGPNGAPLAASTLNAGIYADSGGKPAGSALVNLNGTGTIAAGQNLWTVAPTSSFILAAGTTYWLVLNDPSADSLNWQATNTAPSDPNGPPNAATFAGAGGVVEVSGVVSGNLSAFGPLLVQIDADVVQTGPTGATPEPGTLRLLAGGLFGLPLGRFLSTRYCRG